MSIQDYCQKRSGSWGRPRRRLAGLCRFKHPTESGNKVAPFSSPATQTDRDLLSYTIPYTPDPSTIWWPTNAATFSGCWPCLLISVSFRLPVQTIVGSQ